MESRAISSPNTSHHTTPTNRQLAWQSQENVATATLFVVLACTPAAVLWDAVTTLCFTSSERFDKSSGEWVLGGFDDFMLSRCPVSYGHESPADLYPNATAGRW